MDASVLPPCNFITDATVRPSLGQPNSHRPIVCPSVRPSVIVRVTTLTTAAMDKGDVVDLSAKSLHGIEGTFMNQAWEGAQ
jgi:hypothetical protein